MIKICILTGGELRHVFFRKYLASCNGIKVIKSYCEFDANQTNKEDNFVESEIKSLSILESHFRDRNIFEQDYFGLFCKEIKDFSNPIRIPKGDVNKDEYVIDIINIRPDIIVSYGSSIIKSELLNFFKKKFINVHLGLSPYYRGAGTNFWPFVNDELQFVGTTFMHIDKGIDTGEIIHQIRAYINNSDSIHTIGNRLIRDSVIELQKIILSYEKLIQIPKEFFDKQSISRVYRIKDFNEEALLQARQNIKEGIIDNYLRKKNNIDYHYPIFINSALI